MWAYCGNNPVNRYDIDGEWWILLQALGGVATQYISDVIGNLIAGKTGWDIFKPTSTPGEYIAAGITAMIPGSGFGAAIIRNTISEGITGIEKAIKGEDIDIGQSMLNIALGSTLDFIGEKATAKVEQVIESFRPKNYSSYAGKQRAKKPNIPQSKIVKKMRNTIRVVQGAKTITRTTISLGMSLLK